MRIYLENYEFKIGDYDISLGKIEKIAFTHGVELQYEEDAKYFHNGVEIWDVPQEIHNKIEEYIINQQSIK